MPSRYTLGITYIKMCVAVVIRNLWQSPQRPIFAVIKVDSSLSLATVE